MSTEFNADTVFEPTASQGVATPVADAPDTSEKTDDKTVEGVKGLSDVGPDAAERPEPEHDGLGRVEKAAGWVMAGPPQASDPEAEESNASNDEATDDSGLAEPPAETSVDPETGSLTEAPSDSTAVVVAAEPETTDDGRRMAAPYVWTRDGIYLQTQTEDGGIEEVRLCNFTAKIVADVRRTDGIQVESAYEVEFQLGTESGTCLVPANRFDNLGWVAIELGARAIIDLIPGAKNHIRMAIRLFSGEIPRRLVVGHTGWFKFDGRWIYLSAGHIVSVEGQAPAVQVELPADLRKFELVPVSTNFYQRNRETAVKASLRLREVADEKITIPFLGAIYRAVLGPCDMALHISGATGVFKTSLASLGQQHFGIGFDAGNLPASWLSTSNALERLAHAAKDTILTIDDYVPGETGDAQATAARLFRSIGNAAARARLTGGSRLQSACVPRGLIVSTGEEPPVGPSLCARLVIIEVAPGQINPHRLTDCQADANAGLYVNAMSEYLTWLAPRYQAIRDGLDEELRTLRQVFAKSGQHCRAANNVAQLALGWKYFLEFAREAGAVTGVGAEWHHERVIEVLKQAAATQMDYQNSSDQVLRFFDLLNTGFTTGRCHLRALSGGSPATTQWGWRADPNWQPNGQLIGWTGRLDKPNDKSDDIFLLPEVAYRVAQAVAATKEQKLTVSVHGLIRMLHDRGLLVSTERDARSTRTTRITVNGRRHPVLHVNASVFTNRD